MGPNYNLFTFNNHHDLKSELRHLGFRLTDEEVKKIHNEAVDASIMRLEALTNEMTCLINLKVTQILNGRRPLPEYMR